MAKTLINIEGYVANMQQHREDGETLCIVADDGSEVYIGNSGEVYNNLFNKINHKVRLTLEHIAQPKTVWEDVEK